MLAIPAYCTIHASSYAREMRKIIALAAAVLAAPAVPSLPALAQAETSSPAEQDAHSDLYRAMEAGINQQQLINRMVDVIVEQMVNTEPTTILIEDENPGFLKAMRDAMRPAVFRYSERVRLQYRPQMIDLLRDHLTGDEAASLAGFYNSDLGQRLQAAASGNFSSEQTLASEGEVTEEAISRDLAVSSARTFTALTAEDRAELIRQASAMPAFAKLAAVQQEIAPIRVRMENEPMLPQEEAALVGAIEAVFEAYVP